MILHIPIQLNTRKINGFGIWSFRYDKDIKIRNNIESIFLALNPFRGFHCSKLVEFLEYDCEVYKKEGLYLLNTCRYSYLYIRLLLYCRSIQDSTGRVLYQNFDFLFNFH